MNTQTGGSAPTYFTDQHAISMTLRDYFAAHAPEPPDRWHGGDRSVEDIISWRWVYADSMLKAREA